MIRSIDPRCGERFGPEFPAASEQQVYETVETALGVSAILAGLDAATLAGGLDAVADALDGQSATLAALADEETALGIPRLRGEVGRTTGQLRMFAGLVRSGEHLGITVSKLAEGTPARELCRINVPIGVVTVFAASNFPFAFSVAGGDTVSALAAGCPVVVKAHYGHPQTSERVGLLARSALSAAGVPADALQVLHGDSQTGQSLVCHPGVAAVGFTGSTAAGRALYNLASRRQIPIPVFAELGSINPVVLAPSALGDIKGEAQLLAGSISLGGGQFCTKPGVILVPREYCDTLVSELANALCVTGPVFLLTDKIRQGFERAVDQAARVPGVTTWRPERGSHGYEAAPTVIGATSAILRDRPELREEMFGPAVVIAAVDSLDDLRRTLRVLGGNLTGTIHGDASDPWTAAAVETLRHQVGRLVHGGVPTGVAVDPAMMHGGPYPASSAVRDTSVGTAAIYRFLRPLTYQDFPASLLPAAVQDSIQWRESRACREGSAQ